MLFRARENVYCGAVSLISSHNPSHLTFGCPDNHASAPLSNISAHSEKIRPGIARMLLEVEALGVAVVDDSCLDVHAPAQAARAPVQYDDAPALNVLAPAYLGMTYLRSMALSHSTGRHRSIHHHKVSGEAGYRNKDHTGH